MTRHKSFALSVPFSKKQVDQSPDIDERSGRSKQVKAIPYRAVTKEEWNRIRAKKEAFILIRERVREVGPEESRAETSQVAASGVEAAEASEKKPQKQVNRNAVEGTQLLVEEESGYPSLIRQDTEERILLNKPIFRIGKDRTFTDYKIINNKAVSRRHVELITKHGTCYVRDKNSTNGTQIDGIDLPPETEVEIKPGQTLTIANLSFLFVMERSAYED